jgi:hypothetical protein
MKSGRFMRSQPHKTAAVVRSVSCGLFYVGYVYIIYLSDNYYYLKKYIFFQILKNTFKKIHFFFVT